MRISNKDARRLWLQTNQLSTTPTGKLDLLGLIKQLGFVQLDTIRVVSRAHHHILWTRNQNYREPMLNALLASDRSIFEHFTHDASVIPTEFYPYWRRQFTRLEKKVRQWEWHRGMLDEHERNAIKDRIEHEGPLSTEAFDTKVPANKKKMWARPPHKLALDYMWYAGELATSHRINFKKYYDLAERVIPQDLREADFSEAASLHWLCEAALTRLGFGTEGDIQRFWAAAGLAEVNAWARENSKMLIPVEIQSADKTWQPALAPGDIETRLANAPAATSRLRILNPFDPAIRDRKRLKRLFGFAYTVEMFVPAAKRKWGYYVYPLLEGSRFVGRAEVKADRKTRRLNVLKVWTEPGVPWTSGRAAKFEAELQRLAKLAELDTVLWQCDKIPL